MMADIKPITTKLAPLIRMLASDVDGEALGAARALGRVLEGAGASFHDLADLVEKGDQPSFGLGSVQVVYRDRYPAPCPPIRTWFELAP